MLDDNTTATGKRFTLAKCTNLVRPFMNACDEITTADKEPVVSEAFYSMMQ